MKKRKCLLCVLTIAILITNFFNVPCKAEDDEVFQDNYEEEINFVLSLKRDSDFLASLE